MHMYSIHKNDRAYEKIPPVVCVCCPWQQSESNQAELPAEDHTHAPYVWLLFCHREYWKWIVIGTISILVLMNYKKQVCNPRDSQESNVLLVGIFSLLMRFFYFKGRSTYSIFEKWRLEIRSFGGIYSSGMPLRDVYEEAGLWKFRKRRTLFLRNS